MHGYPVWSIQGSLIAALALLPVSGHAQAAAGPSSKSASGKYVVTLRPLPPGGIFAEEETDIEFFIGDAGREDPILGPAPVIRADIRGRFSMPAMPGMPEAASQAHVEGQPGYYGVVTSFAHGGNYLMRLIVRPSGEEPFTVEFHLKVNDAQSNRPRPYLVQLETAPASVQAGEPADLRLRIVPRSKPESPLRDFDIVHEKRMHLIVVSRDLSFFEHLHPELDSATGVFRIRYTFPAGGEYRLFADVAPKDAGTQVLLAPLIVEGHPPVLPVALAASDPLQAEAGGVSIEIRPKGGALKARTDQALVMSFAADGAPVTDLQPWLGAMGHLVMIGEDAATYVHSHPQEAVPPAGKAAPSTLSFYARFPKPGLYKGWVQFQRGGEVRTAPFVVRVEEG